MNAATTADHATAYRDAFGGLKTIGLALGAACLLGFGLLVALSTGGGLFADKTPYLALEGGGFLYNYRIAEVTYGLTTKVERPIPAGTLIRATLENPAGGAPLVVEKTAREGLAKLTLQSPPVHGVKANRPYAVDVSLIDPADGREIGHLATSFKSDLDDTIMPDKPLVVGPGYQKPAP
ncbi:hypothetical protein [Segnochrobactrum spirostomi]|uniref:Uncharacterized protein n=1 Tax=Segnochrobactrum spirostomi TaxID=2608987 RepID=A0A6A7Y2R6_9HYPH|nr:hypothetical protein [Segnochrobactrum spirostomi]MQT13036.1 hypothetical protein [Segnochrobactrum spirostomi]